MAFWHHVMADRSCRLSFLYRTWYHSLGHGARPSLASRGGGWPVSYAPEESRGMPPSLKDSVQLMAVRFFAAPVQAKPKEAPNSMQGPRLNEAITARFIRLVTDAGHGVMSKGEALDRARRLNLDLVEVQRTAKPPVCKIMDYHKEKYKKETTEKERAKGKSESTIRKGDFKEVRLKGKIEQKDIEVKAEAVKGLTERGYRVKCMALPSKQRGSEECDLGALLSRLTDLIEDVIIVESGPFVEQQQAYVVVRHVKFGSKKGSRKKAIKTVETTSGAERIASITPALDSAALDLEAVEPTDTNGETEDEVLSDPEDDVQDVPSGATTSPLMFDSCFDKNIVDSTVTGKLDSLGSVISGMLEGPPASTAYCSMNARSERNQIDRHMPSKPIAPHSDFSSEDGNRYSRRTDMKFRSDQTNATERKDRVPEVKATSESHGFSTNKPNKFSRSPGTENVRWAEPQRSNQGNILQRSSAYENQQHELLDLNRGQMPLNESLPEPSYGIFSSATDRRMPDVNRNKERSPLISNKNAPNMPKSKDEVTGQNNDMTNKGGWGVFSRPISIPSQDKSSGER
uniref:Translation initiation factor IF-3 n=1 Tax=Anthurium amnicola TaxID=1678845 RepID=A0A1D1YG11_9ARAE